MERVNLSLDGLVMARSSTCRVESFTLSCAIFGMAPKILYISPISIVPSEGL